MEVVFEGFSLSHCARAGSIYTDGKRFSRRVRVTSRQTHHSRCKLRQNRRHTRRRQSGQSEMSHSAGHQDADGVEASDRIARQLERVLFSPGFIAELRKIMNEDG